MRLAVRVVPNARKTEFSGWRDKEILLRLNAPAIEGRGNKAAVEFLADYFGTARSKVILVSGEKSRHKVFELVGLDESRILRMLRDLQR